MHKWNVTSSYVIAACAAVTILAEANVTTCLAAPSGNGSLCSQAQPSVLEILNGKLKAGNIGLLTGGLYQDMQVKQVNSAAPDQHLIQSFSRQASYAAASEFQALMLIIMAN